MGYNWIWSVPLRYGFHLYGDFNLKDIEVETVIKQIHGLEDILVKLQSSKCVYILFSCTQHVSGSIYPILDNPPRLATNVNSIWLSYFSSLLKKV